MTTHELELVAVERDGRVLLLSPTVGWFTCARARGRVLTPGESAGVLKSLEDAYELVCPPGAAGRIVSERPERVHEPVEHGSVLYELAPLDADDADDAATPLAAARPAGTAAELAFRAPYSGRFWQRPAPGDPPFVEPGYELADGATLGLIEVMKTFTHLHYHPAAGLPPKAKVVRMLVADGAEVNEGDALVELEPA